MVLTKQRSPRNHDAFPTFQLFLLAIVRLAEPIALTSIFPYAWSLVRHFHFGDEQDASFYAGILISAFSLTEALMGMYWGGLSDRIGRKPVLVVGCVGTMLSMIAVGFATNIWVALLGRAFGGLLNGNIGVIQTMVGELVTKPEHEPRAFAVMPFVWSIGTICGPAIGGIFANPHETWPKRFPENSVFTKFPYLLPNVLCAALLLVSIVLGVACLEETHPDMQPRVRRPNDTYVTDETPLLETSDALKQPAVDLRAETYGSFRNRDSLDFAPETRGYVKDFEEKGTLGIFNKHTMALIISLSIFTYHSMTYDHLMPIFFEDKKADLGDLFTTAFNPFYSPGGLGLSMQTVGMISAINGGIALFVQVVVFPLAAEKIGVFRLFVFVTVLHPIAYLIVPCLVYVPDWMLLPAIYLCLTVRNLLSIVLYPLLLILIKESTPSPDMLGSINGLAASAGAACRMIAPPVAGYLYSFGSQIDCTSVAWYGSAFVAAIGSMQCFLVRRDRQLEAIEELNDEGSEDC
ncbi:major facilitator superfamily domain-containing protein [Xylaria bambusicola]|uniref:major facilitator superfamily domain-containing protein n=1 Tax=Xylaria bambusicola TaxID=326684 RepID=UPI002008A61F|nr:major facilitator superfamily domain-containing protein [Xylaria bambusicola]KAI0521452.1 major facilitator superfamily domain-containing protein [Xylaria bambusicola]